jgi:SAM-dependent methyltransferase
MLDQETPPLPASNIRDIKRAIQRRVPFHHAPLPVDGLFRHETELAYRQDFLELAVPPAGPSFRDRVRTFVKRLFRTTLRWVLIRQVEFNGVLLEHLRESARLFTLLDRSMSEVVARVMTLQNQVETLNGQNQQLHEEIASLHRKHQQLNDTLTAYRLRWKRLHQFDVNGDAAHPLPLIDYFLFENQFRGPREEVRRRQSVYVPYFKDQGPVLDIGCGRGEFVELLTAEQIPVTGIDANPDMADFCQELGLPVVRDEAMPYLGRQDDHSLGGIFLGRVVEQMSPDAFVQLLSLCWAKLRKGGVLVVQAINPLCPRACEDFFVDPTRVRPVHPDLLRFLFESQRLTILESIYTSPVDGQDEPVVRSAAGSRWDATRYQAHALVGRK